MQKQEHLKGLATAWPEDNEQSPALVYFQPPRRQDYGVHWFTVWQDDTEVGLSMLEQARMEHPLTQTEYRVRDWLLGTIGIGNYVYVNQAEMARQLNVRKASVCDAIKSLIGRGILLRGPKSGRCNTYMVSPAFAFSGSLGDGVKQRRDAIKKAKAKRIPFQPLKAE